MWCCHCGQDVRARTSAEAGRFECPRCKAAVCDRMATRVPPRRDPPRKYQSSPPGIDPVPRVGSGEREPPPLDLWECDEQLRHAARVLGLTGPGRGVAERKRFDLAHRAVMPSHHAQLQPALGEHGPDMPPSLRMIWGAASLALWLGTVALTCGGVLLGLSVWGGREPLWAVGLPILSGGLCVLSAGALGRTACTQPVTELAATAELAGVGPKTPQDGPHSRPPVDRHAERTA